METAPMHGMLFNAFSSEQPARYADHPSNGKKPSVSVQVAQAEPSTEEQPESRHPIIRLQWPRTRSIWHKFSLLGSLGLALLVPVLLGAALGLWIDTLWPSTLSWTSILTPIGIVLGCLSAGYWFRQDENKD